MRKHQDHTPLPSAFSAVVLHGIRPLTGLQRAHPPKSHLPRLTLPASTASRPAIVTIALAPLSEAGWEEDSGERNIVKNKIGINIWPASGSG
jgi:hypothetical protein